MNTYFWWTNRRTGGETGEHQNKHKNRLLVTANSTSPGRTPNMKTSLLSRIYTIYTTDTVRLTPSTVMNRNTYNIVIFTYSTRPVQNFVLIFKIFICICCDKIFLHIHRPLRDSCTVHLTLNCNMITLIFLSNTWVFIYNIFISEIIPLKRKKRNRCRWPSSLATLLRIYTAKKKKKKKKMTIGNVLVNTASAPSCGKDSWFRELLCFPSLKCPFSLASWSPGRVCFPT